MGFPSLSLKQESSDRVYLGGESVGRQPLEKGWGRVDLQSRSLYTNLSVVSTVVYCGGKRKLDARTPNSLTCKGVHYFCDCYGVGVWNWDLVPQLLQEVSFVPVSDLGFGSTNLFWNSRRTDPKVHVRCDHHDP